MPLFPLVPRAVTRPFRRRTKPGAAPGTVRVHPDSPKPVVHIIAYGPEQFEERDLENLDELPALLERFAVTWIDVSGLGDADIIRGLGEKFGLHPLALEDVVNVHQRAKVEEYDERLFIVARMVAIEERVETEQISMFLGKNFVLTFQERPGDCLEPVRARVRKARSGIRADGIDYLAYALIDAIVDGYFPVLEEFGGRVDALEDDVARRETEDVVARIHQLRSDLLVVRRSIWPHREAVNALLRDRHPLFSDRTRLYLRDCYDHTVQIIDVTENYRDMCSDLRDFHFSQLSIRQNEVMKVLTIIATIFIPLGFIAGVYGMNFDTDVSPWNMPELEWFYGYPFALALMAAVAGIMLIFFRRRGWLGGRRRREPD
ncbi:MAG: magnesium/cobalt transporter CorA [Planctomycetes bacterium]|nr:magnesium/cobalt transporter CorA [Planctomycetota bacterium]